MLAFAFAHGVPFGGESIRVRQIGRGRCCRASAQSFASSHGCLGGPRWSRGASAEGDSMMRFQLVDTPESIIIYFDASGYDRKSVKLSLTDDGELRLMASKEGLDAAVDKSWKLPDTILRDGISAKWGNGDELQITLPKVANEKKASFEVPIVYDEAVFPDSEPKPPTEDAPGPSEAPKDTDKLHDIDVDGSWVDVADEDIVQARSKDKASDSQLVLEDADAKEGCSLSSHVADGES